MATKQYVDVGGRRLALTNLDKVMYAGSGFTKAHVIDYYIRVSNWLLPHFAKRPLTMNRFPDGAGSKGFYEKDAPGFTPDWVHTTEVPRSAGGTPIRYICIDDLPTLVWCANVASLELHLFLHRAGALDRPTMMVFDLDPGEGANLSSCAEVSMLLRERLRRAELECFPKLSGSKGLQLYVPLNTAVTYDSTRAAALAVAVSMQKEHPSLVVAEMAKDLRRGKVFIDWSQNSDFKTTIGVYSLRAKRDVPRVSAPVSWDEVESLRKKQNAGVLEFGPEELLARVEKIGDLFAPVLELEQRLDALTGAGTAAPKGKTVVASQARFYPPMLLEPTERLPEGANWLYEIKLDGYRALAWKAQGEVQLRSRNDNDFRTRFPTIASALEGLPEDTVVDGEVVALDEQGNPSFSLLQNYRSSKTPLVYYVFDLLVLRGDDVRPQPLRKRRELLEREVLPALEEPVRVSGILEASLDQLIAAVQAQGLEGLVAKRADSEYEAGARSGAWRKMRVNQSEDLVIGGYTPGTRHFDALIIGYWEEGRLLFAAKTRNGFTPGLREEVFRKIKPLEIAECPFANLPEKSAGRWGQGLTKEKMKECRWVKPEIEARFGFVEWTPERHLRHARFIGLKE